MLLARQENLLVQGAYHLTEKSGWGTTIKTAV